MNKNEFFHEKRKKREQIEVLPFCSINLIFLTKCDNREFGNSY